MCYIMRGIGGKKDAKQQQLYGELLRKPETQRAVPKEIPLWKKFRTAVKNYIQFYNEERPHATNQYKTPEQKEADYFSIQAKNR